MTNVLDFSMTMVYNYDYAAAAWKGCYHCIAGITGDTQDTGRWR